MATQIKLRRDTAANWALEDPVLAQGEPGYDTTNNILKIGDGSTIWSLLPSIYDPSTNIIPSADNTYDLGSPTKQWRHVYTAGGSIYLDNIKLTNVGGKFVATKVINPGEENEAEDPEDSDATSEIGGGSGSGDRLTSGDNEFVLNGPNIDMPDGGQIWFSYGYIDQDEGEDSNALRVSGGNGVTIKAGEDTSTWRFNNDGSLTFPDGTIQTTAYTGQSGGGSTSTLYVAVNSDGRSFTSSDGLSWTEYTTNMLGVGRVAVGPDMIVYTANAVDVSNGNNGALWYASTSTPGTVTEVTGFDSFSFNQVKYFASIEKFVAVGSNTDNLPVILYSSNGTSWTPVSLDSGFLAAFNSGSGYTANAAFYDIETNGTGFLLITSDNNLGAFYTTDITTSMGQTNWIDFSGFGLDQSFTKIAYAAAGFFTGWHIMQTNSSSQDAWYQNSNANPTSGVFSEFTLADTGSMFVSTINYEPDVSEVVFGDYNGITTIMMSTNDGQILYWPAIPNGPFVSIPKPYTATDFDITQSSTATITFGTKTALTNEKIVLSNCTPSDYNGTYYVDNNNFLYTNANMGTAFDSSGLGSFVSGTLTFSHGQYIDALHYSNGKFYAGNDDEEMFVSTDGGATWTLTDTFTGSPGEPEYMNDIDSYVTTTSGSSLTNGSYSFTLNSDGTIALPAIEMTAYEPGYTIDGPTLQMGNDPTVGETIITGPAPNSNNPSARRLIIQGQRGYGGWGDSAVGEGGDIYLWAGTGGENSSGNVGSGGDIKIRGGVGQAGTEGGAHTEGGYVKIEGGDVQWGYGAGGFVDINAGSTNQGSGGTGDGGDVNIRAGQGSVNNGEVHIYTSSNGSNYNNEWVFKNDGSLQLPNGGFINGAELIGDGSSAGTGFKRTVYTDYFNGQGGEADGNGNQDWFYTTDVTGVEVGDTITFRQGEVRTISNVTVNGLYTAIDWSGDAVTGSDTLPRYPVTITSSDYSAPEKKKARIKPDLTAANDWGHYMDIYAGGGSPVIDSKHIHMSGHTGEIELFLGTDSNYVSAKEAGTAPAGVRLHSENDVAVESSNLRINRKGSTWAAVYGDGNNVTSDGNTSNLTFDCIAVDEHGDYYVGGEHCWRADAIISKYGRDGNLIWSNYSEGSVITGFEPQAIAYHDGEVASVVKTNNGRTTLYLKLVVQDSTTGEVKSTTDIYDPDNTIRANSMIYHSTLGWVVVGKTWGETLVSSAITATGNTGVGIIELPSAQTKLENIYPETNGDWYMTGTSITGDQFLTTGVGMYRDVPITTVTGSGAGAVARVTVGYNGGGTYDLTVTTQGSGYAINDELKIPGSLLGGVDAMSTVTATPNSVSPGADITAYFDKATYPDLYDQLNWASYTVSYNAGTHDVISIVSSGDNWAVTIDSSDINLSVATFYTANGNDLTFLAQVSGDALVGPGSSPAGVASRKTIRIDMGFAMGYGSVDFTGGTFTISRHLATRPWVWTSGWTRYLDPAINYGSGTAYTVAEVPASGVLVGGYIDGTPTNHSFIWKLNTNGSTGWLKGILADGNGVRSLAVSSVDGSIYVTTNYNQGTLTKLDYTGALQSRIGATGLWGLAPKVKLEIDLDGNEQVYVGGSGGAIWIGPYGVFMLNKFTSSLQPVWGRSMHYTGGESINLEYNGEPYDNFILGKGQATLVGYSNLFSTNYTNAVMFTMDTTDEFTPVNNVWEIKTHADQVWNAETDWATNDLLALGIEAKTSSASTDIEVTGLALSQWRFQERVVNLNEIPNGIVGVESITFADGNVLDHNPSDIPPSTGFNPNSSWNYTLQLSDRGRFIINQTIPNVTYVQTLYITVPRNDNVPFPVGTVITLINTNSITGNAYKIYVQPESYGDPNAPQIWSTNGNQNPSTWSFQGIQTATLMKISSNGWLLTGNDITNED